MLKGPFLKDTYTDTQELLVFSLQAWPLWPSHPTTILHCPHKLFALPRLTRSSCLVPALGHIHVLWRDTLQPAPSWFLSVLPREAMRIYQGYTGISLHLWGKSSVADFSPLPTSRAHTYGFHELRLMQMSDLRKNYGKRFVGSKANLFSAAVNTPFCSLQSGSNEVSLPTQHLKTALLGGVRRVPRYKEATLGQGTPAPLCPPPSLEPGSQSAFQRECSMSSPSLFSEQGEGTGWGRGTHSSFGPTGVAVRGGERPLGAAHVRDQQPRTEPVSHLAYFHSGAPSPGAPSCSAMNQP